MTVECKNGASVSLTQNSATQGQITDILWQNSLSPAWFFLNYANNYYLSQLSVEFYHSEDP